MTRKDYIAMAKYLTAKQCSVDIILEVAEMLEAVASNFDKAKFISFCKKGKL